MRIFKNKPFHKWAKSEGLSDHALLDSVKEIARGLVDADLGGGIIKKRIAMGGQGKRSGFRTLLAYQSGKKVFFVYGFSKSELSNISIDELKALKRLSKELLAYNDLELSTAINHGALIEVKNED